MNNDIFSEDEHGNTLFYKWGKFGSSYIINDEEMQNELKKFIQSKNLLMKVDLRIYAIFFIAPIYFGLKYLFPETPVVLAIIISLIIVPTIFIWDYSNQIDKILTKEKD